MGEIILNRGAIQSFLLSNGIYNWKVPLLSGATIGIFTIATLMFSFWIFVSNVRKQSTRVLKFRSLTMAFAILMMAVGIYIPKIVVYLSKEIT